MCGSTIRSTIAGDRVYLMGNGYAPTITIRNADGDVVFDESVPFLPQDTNMTSLGVVKVTDGLPEQLGMIGFFYPTQAPLDSGAFTSAYPALINPVLTLNVYEGDLGIDDGTPRSVYTLDPTDMTQLTGGKTGVESIELAPGDTQDLPNGLGTITFQDESAGGAEGYDGAVKRYVSLSLHRDIAAPWVLGFAILRSPDFSRRSSCPAGGCGSRSRPTGTPCASSTPASRAARTRRSGPPSIRSCASTASARGARCGERSRSG